MERVSKNRSLMFVTRIYAIMFILLLHLVLDCNGKNIKIHCRSPRRCGKTFRKRLSKKHPYICEVQETLEGCQYQPKFNPAKAPSSIWSKPFSYQTKRNASKLALDLNWKIKELELVQNVSEWSFTASLLKAQADNIGFLIKVKKNSRSKYHLNPSNDTELVFSMNYCDGRWMSYMQPCCQYFWRLVACPAYKLRTDDTSVCAKATTPGCTVQKTKKLYSAHSTTKSPQENNRSIVVFPIVWFVSISVIGGLVGGLYLYFRKKDHTDYNDKPSVLLIINTVNEEDENIRKSNEMAKVLKNSGKVNVSLNICTSKGNKLDNENELSKSDHIVYLYTQQGKKNYTCHLEGLATKFDSFIQGLDYVWLLSPKQEKSFSIAYYQNDFSGQDLGLPETLRSKGNIFCFPNDEQKFYAHVTGLDVSKVKRLQYLSFGKCLFSDFFYTSC